MLWDVMGVVCSGYVAGGEWRKEREERGRVCRRRSVAEGEGEERACMSREECCGRRGRKEGVYVAGAGGEGGERA